MFLLLNSHQIISSLSDLWGCFTMCMDCKSDSSLEQYSDHHQIIRSSAPCQNCGDLEGLLSGTWRLLGCCTIHMIQVPSSDLWRLFGALHKYIIQCFITDSRWLKSYCGLYITIQGSTIRFLERSSSLKVSSAEWSSSDIKSPSPKLGKIGHYIMKSLHPKSQNKTWTVWG